jgi:hypothetical protein
MACIWEHKGRQEEILWLVTGANCLATHSFPRNSLKKNSETIQLRFSLVA